MLKGGENLVEELQEHHTRTGSYIRRITFTAVFSLTQWGVATSCASLRRQVKLQIALARLVGISVYFVPLGA